MTIIDNIMNLSSSSSTSSDPNLSKTNTKVWVYRGNQGAPIIGGVVLSGDNDRPNEPTLNLNSSSIKEGNTMVTQVGLNNLLHDYITHDITQKGDSALWVDIQRTLTIGGVEIIQPSEHYLGLDGYDYTSDVIGGYSEVLLSNDHILKLVGTSSNIPIVGLNYIGHTYKKGGLDVEVVEQSFESLDSSKQVRYLTSSTSDVDRLDVRFRYDELGDEMVLNRQFKVNSTWVIDNDFSIGNNLASLNSNDLDVSRIHQVLPLDGESLRVSFEVSGFSGSGSLEMRYPFPITIDRNGTYIEYGVGEYDRVQFQGKSDDNSNLLNLDIHSVSVKKVISMGDVITKTITFEDIEECRYTPHMLSFINKLGTFQNVWFYGNTRRTLGVKRSTMGTNERNETRSRVDSSKDSLSLNSGFYNENNNVVFEELLQSEDVWIWDSEKSRYLPIMVKTSSLDFKDSNTNKLINYKIDIEYAFNKIKSI